MRELAERLAVVLEEVPGLAAESRAFAVRMATAPPPAPGEPLRRLAAGLRLSPPGGDPVLPARPARERSGAGPAAPPAGRAPAALAAGTPSPTLVPADGEDVASARGAALAAGAGGAACVPLAPAAPAAAIRLACLHALVRGEIPV